MNRKKTIGIIMTMCLMLLTAGSIYALECNSAPPDSPVKLIFIHHSCGENWLTDDNGGLGTALRDNNYFVSDTNYGWGPNSIGDNTDIGHWYDWFAGSDSSLYLNALYNESSKSGDFYSRMSHDPGGENEIIMFKSCFPNSYLSGNPGDPTTGSSNPLRSEGSWSENMTVANAKGIYNDILSYFATRQDKLFIVVTAPPQAAADTDAAHAANARALNNWLVNDWLKNYPYSNVGVFDFYNVLTSNSGTSSISDAGKESGNHHRCRNGIVQHVQTVNSNMSAYPTDDSHPSAAGNRKAAEEYIGILNTYYQRWQKQAPPEETETGYAVTNDLRIRAVIQTEEKGAIEAVWQEGGRDLTNAGDQVIWGYFYASPDDVSWGSSQNPDLFVKIWLDHNGRLDVNFFHVSVPNIDVYSEYKGLASKAGTTTMDVRYIRQWYENNQTYMEKNEEDGNPQEGDSTNGNPSGYDTVNALKIGAVINIEGGSPIEAVWHKGGGGATESGDQVLWGHFYASPDAVSWGSENNPDLFVKIWFDHSGRVDVNFFHVSVPDIEVYSALPGDGAYNNAGTTLMANRYIRHEYMRYELVSLETDYGDIVMWLYNQTPLHKANFLRLVKAGFYDNTIFHRVINDFVVQGGMPRNDWAGTPDLINAEITDDLTHVYGAVGAARTADEVNPERKSSGSQFYIVEDANGEHGLDTAYTVFGQVIHGMDAVGAIAEVKTNSSGLPLENVYLRKAEILMLTAEQLEKDYNVILNFQ